MDEEVEKEKDDEAYERERAERLRKDQEATEKKRRKREKLKLKKGKNGKVPPQDGGPSGEKAPGKVMPRSANVDADTAAGGGGMNGAGEVEEVKTEGLIICDDD